MKNPNINNNNKILVKEQFSFSANAPFPNKVIK